MPGQISEINGLAIRAANSNNADYATNAGSASLAVSASFATTASFAISASRATTSSFATTASYVLSAISASRATTSSFAFTSSYILNAISSSFASTASSVNTLNQNVSVSGAITASIFAATDNGNGTNFKIGDDVWIGDINVANTFGIRGQQTATNGYVRFGSGSSNPVLGSSGTSVLELTGALSMSSGSITLTTGSVTMPNRPAFRVTGAGGGKTAVTVLSGSYLNVDYQQGSGWNNSTGTFTAPIAGLYQVDVVVRTNSNSLGTISQLIVYKNNTSISPLDGTVQIMVEFGANTTMNHAGGSTIAKLAAGDTLKMVVAVGQISFDSNDNFSVAYIG